MNEANLTRFDSALELPVTRVSCATKSRFKKGLGFNVIGSSE